MTIPQRHAPRDLAEVLAIISRAIFQAGLSWKLIDSKWDAYLRLFEGFDPKRVSDFTDAQIDAIMDDGGVVRTRKKIVATVANARTLLAIVDTFGSFHAYVASFHDYTSLAKDMRARFAFLGELSVYYVLFRTGETVPRFEEWEKTIPGVHPRMREMIAHARATGTLLEEA